MFWVGVKRNEANGGWTDGRAEVKREISYDKNLKKGSDKGLN